MKLVDCTLRKWLTLGLGFVLASVGFLLHYTNSFMDDRPITSSATAKVRNVAEWESTVNRSNTKRPEPDMPATASNNTVKSKNEGGPFSPSGATTTEDTKVAVTPPSPPPPEPAAFLTPPPPVAAGRNLDAVKREVANLDEVMEAMERSMLHFARAHRYVKGGKAATELKEGLAILLALRNRHYGTTASLKLKEKNAREVIKNQTADGSLDVCPEVWRASPYGWPFFLDNFIIDPNCTEAPPLGSVLTIVINTIGDTDFRSLPQILEGLALSYPKVPLIIGVSKDENETQLQQLAAQATGKGLNVSLQQIKWSSSGGDGSVWNELIGNVTTKYVLIGRKLTHFLPEARLERLVRLLNYINADAVAGSYRNESGHWVIGCFQTTMRNYAFRLVEGYDLSYNSCVYCDYLGGPFAARTAFLKDRFAYLNGDAVFVDMFTMMHANSAKAKLMVCPDSMFFVQKMDLSDIKRKHWLGFASKWQVSQVILPDRSEHRFSCAESRSECAWLKGIAMPKCCLDELSGLMKTLSQVCDDNNIAYMYEAGSVIGGVKFNGNLPWERDGDLYLDSTSYKTMLSTTQRFKDAGYTLVEESDPEDVGFTCMHNTSKIYCGYFALRSPNWRIQIYGVTQMPYDRWSPFFKVQNFTRTLHDGQWVRNQPNPALYARNIYGDDIFEHVEHWITLGHSAPGWQPYETGKWLQCPQPGFHGCLDQYLAYGNLQFLDTWV